LKLLFIRNANLYITYDSIIRSCTWICRWLCVQISKLRQEQPQSTVNGSEIWVVWQSSRQRVQQLW